MKVLGQAFLLLLFVGAAFSVTYYPRVSLFNESVGNLIYDLDGSFFVSVAGNVTVYNPNTVDDLYAAGIVFGDKNITVQNASGASFPPPFMVGNVPAAGSASKGYGLQTTGFTHSAITKPLGIAQAFYRNGRRVGVSNGILNESFVPGDSIRLVLNISNNFEKAINVSVSRNLIFFINWAQAGYSSCAGASLNFTPGTHYLKLERCSLAPGNTTTISINGTIADIQTPLPPPYYIDRNVNMDIMINNRSYAEGYSFFREAMTAGTGGASASVSLEKQYFPKAERDRCYPLDNMTYELSVNFSTDTAFNFTIKNVTVLRSNYTTVNLSADINRARVVDVEYAETSINSTTPYASKTITDSFCADANYVIPTYWLKSDYSVAFNNSPAPSYAVFENIEAEGGMINIVGIYVAPTQPEGSGGSMALEAPANITKEQARRYLIVTKEVSKQRVNYGDIITVTLRVHSIAPFNIRGLTLTDLLPIGFRVVDTGGAGVGDEEPYLLRWDIEQIQPNEIMAFQYKALSVDAAPGYYALDNLYISSVLTGVVGAYSTQPIVQEPSIGIPRQYTILLVKKLEWLGSDLYKVTITVTNIGNTISPRFTIRDTLLEKKVVPPDSPLFGQEKVTYTFIKKTWQTPEIEPGKDYSFTYFEEGPAPETGLPDIYGGDPSKVYKTMVIVPVIEESHIFSGSVRIEQFSFGLLLMLLVIVVAKRRRKRKEWYEEKMFAAKVGKLRQIERHLNPLRRV